MYQGQQKFLECVPQINENIITGNYFQARKLLKENYRPNVHVLNQYYGLLENIENNFHRSKEYYNNCSIFKGKELSALLSLSKIHLQLGDYSIAKDILTNLQKKESYYYQATINLIFLYILVKDYEQAYYLYETINVEEIPVKTYKQCQIIKTYLLKKLGKTAMLKKIDCSTNYTVKRITNNCEEDLIKHIKRHVNLENEFTNGKFVTNIDFKKLLEVINKEIQHLNPNHFEISDIYRFSLNEPIGYKDNQLTTDIAVATLLDTKTIITMYPVNLSPEFNIEQNANDSALKLKRQNRLL